MGKTIIALGVALATLVPVGVLADGMPPEAQKVLKGAHGGFSVDLRKGKGETYFALKGAGIIQISADLKSTRMVDTPEEARNTNLHNTTIWHAQDGASHLLFPGNEANKVFVAGLDGKLESIDEDLMRWSLIVLPAVGSHREPPSRDRRER